MKIISVLASAVAALSLMSGAATAQGAPSVKQACAADIEKFCPGTTDRHALRKCMKSHKADVTPDCRSAMKAAKLSRAGHKAGTPTVATSPTDGASPASDTPPATGPLPSASPH